MIIKKYNEDAGFTLVEIMIALFILSVGIMGVTGMFITTIKANQFARTTTAGNRLAQHLMEQVKTTSFDNVLTNMCIAETRITNCSPLAPGITSRTGTYQEAAAGNLNVVVYNVTLQQTPDSPIEGLDTVSVTVTWNDAYGPHTTRLITYIEQ